MTTKLTYLLAHVITFMITWVTGSHVIVREVDGSIKSIHCIDSCLHDDDYLRHVVSNSTESLKITGEKIGELNSTKLFAGQLMTALTSLDLTNNYITEITPGAFRSTPNLVSLTLAGNAWITDATSSDVFVGTGSIRHLDLRSTFVNDADSTTATNDSDSDVTAVERLLGNASEWLSELEALDLRDNGLKSFPIEAVTSSMPSLRELWLSGNLLETIEFRAASMHNVSQVHVDGNAISRISRESIANLIILNESFSLELVNVSNNPIECSCRNSISRRRAEAIFLDYEAGGYTSFEIALDENFEQLCEAGTLKWFVQWIRRSLDASSGSSRLLVDVEQLTCHHPPHLLGRALHTVQAVEIDSQLCRPRAPPYGMAQIVGVALVGLFIFVLVVRVLMSDRKIMRRKLKDGADVGSTLPSSYWQVILQT